MIPERVSTQISGKYTPQDPIVLHVRHSLLRAKIDVRYPQASEFVAVRNGVHYTFDPDITPVADVERDLVQINSRVDIPFSR